jgi:general secretion pathway protein I
MMRNDLHAAARGETLTQEDACNEPGDVEVYADGGLTPQSARIMRDRRSPAGFTLLEIMVAVAIIGGLLVSLLYSLNYHLGIADTHEFVTVASLLAKDKLSEVEKKLVPQKGDFPSPFSDYHFESSVRESPYTGIAEITVTVSRGKAYVKLSDLVEERK